MKNKGALALENAMLFSEEKSTKSEPDGFGFWLFGGANSTNSEHAAKMETTLSKCSSM